MTVPTELKPLIGTTGFLVLAEVKYYYTPTLSLIHISEPTRPY